LNSETLADFTEPFSARDILRGIGLSIWASVAWYATYRLLWSVGVESASAVGERHSLDTFRVPFSATYFLAMVVNPFAEEFFMRGFLQTRLKQAGWKWLIAVLASVSLQTSYHLYQGTLACLSVAPPFLVFALYYQANRRLWPVIVAHLIWDLLAMFTSMQI